MKKTLFLIASISMLFMGCKKDNPQLGNPPTLAEASFTYSVSSTSANVLDLTANNQNYQCLWDFGNGVKAQGATAAAETSLEIPAPKATVANKVSERFLNFIISSLIGGLKNTYFYWARIS